MITVRSSPTGKDKSDASKSCRKISKIDKHKLHNIKNDVVIIGKLENWHKIVILFANVDREFI